MALQFQNPLMLFGILAIAIPIIIHLFKFRKFKVVYFSNTSFLQALKQENRSKTQLKHILVLIARILTLISLAFAFAMPFIPVGKSNVHASKHPVVGIYIDNSFSMLGEGSNGQLLEEAKKRAETIIKAYSPATKFIIQDNDNKASTHFLLSKEKALEQIKTIIPSPVSIPESMVLKRVKTIVDNNQSGTRATLYVISDFQKSSSDFASMQSDSLLNCTFVPVSPRIVANVYVDSCWFDNPMHSQFQPEKIFVSIVNASDEEYTDIPVKLYINDTSKALSSVSLKAQEKKIIQLDYSNTSSGIMRGKVELSDYPIMFDNSYYFSYTIQSVYSVLEINEKEPNPYISSLFKSDPLIKLSNVNALSVQYSTLKTYDAIILNGLTKMTEGLQQELSSVLKNNGCILMFPAPKIDLQSYNAFFSSIKAPLFGAIDTTDSKAGGINYKHPLFKNVFKKEVANGDLPSFFMHYTVQNNSNSATNSILWTESKDAVIYSTLFDGGMLYVVTSPCDDKSNSLVKHPLFVPLVLNAVIGKKVSEPISYVIGNNTIAKVTTPTSDEKMLRITNTARSIDFIPQQMTISGGAKTSLNIGGEIPEAGFYTVQRGTTTISVLACNFNRTESKMDFYNPEQIETLTKQYLPTAKLIDKPHELTGESIKQMERGIQLWKWFILAALSFILAEICLIRFWK